MGKGLILTISLALVLPRAWPQASTSSISGTVTDQSAAAIPHTEVVLTNTGTNVSVTTRTNEAGFYLFRGMIPGAYKLSLEAPGMERYEGAITVQVAYSVVVNPVLRPGQVTSRVEVTDVTPIVTVDNATVRQTVNLARIEQLPTNGRMLNTFLNILPGAEGSGGENGHRSFGLPGQAQEWIVDGAVVTDRRWNMSLFSQDIGVGSVQEFTLDTSAVSAKLSRPSNVFVSTRSGTSAFHGSAYDTSRNSGIGVARRRQDYWTKAPTLIRNEFGMNAGGPVIIPKLYNGKERTFWFFNLEFMRRITSSTRGVSVPTEAMRNGDFSGLVDSQGRLYTLYDPLTTNSQNYARQPFSYGGKLNAIDPKRIGPLAQYLFSITPLPNSPASPMLDSNYWYPTTTWQKNKTFTVRVDQRFSDRDQFYFRMTYLDDPSTYYSGIPFTNKVAGWKHVLDGERSAAASWVRTISPTLFNEVLLTGRYRIGGGYPGTSRTLDTNWLDKLGTPNPFGVNGWPQMTNTGLSNYTISGPGTDIANETFVSLDDNMTLVRGTHELQFGGHVRKDLMNVHPNDNGASSMNWGTLATALYDPRSTPTSPLSTPYTGYNLANMFLGHSTYTASLMRSWYYLRGGETALYFQDNYKLTRRLTLNLGLRWEYWQAYRDKNNILVGFDRDSHSTVLGTDLDVMYAQGATLPSVVARYQQLGWKYKSWKDAGVPQNLVHSRDKNFGPRLGFAYQALSGRNAFVVRGGYSLSYFPTDQNSFISAFNNNTPLAATFDYDPNSAAQSPDGLANYLLRSAPAYVNGANDRKAINLNEPRGIARGSAQAYSFSPHLPDSKVHSWNLTVEKEIMQSTVVRLRYIGSHVANLNQWYDYNSATPDYLWYVTTGQALPTGEYASVARRPYDQQVLGTVRQYQASGWANNQAFDVEFERRFRNGYAFDVSYVMTNALSTSQFSTIPEVNQYLPGAAPADLAQRNRFLNYQRDTAIPKHRVRWNWLLDLPFGKGKLVGRNAGVALDKLIGGWQLAGLGSLRSTYFSLPTGNWNFTGEPVKMYGYQYPIQDCTTGACYPGYLWWNGYLPSNQINSVDSSGRPNGYMGVPADYKSAVTPLIPWGSTTLPANAPANTVVSTYWDTNNVWLPLKNGTTQRVTYNPNLNPWRNQYLPSARLWVVDASLFKNIPIYERISLRFSADFFNVFNMPGNPSGVAGTGVLSTRNSGQAARILQLGLRLSW